MKNPWPLALILLVAVSLWQLPANAATRPGFIPMTAGSTQRTNQFECGTYKGNQATTLWMDGHYQRTLRKIRNGKQQRLAAAEFVYDDVWVVEDDGTILMQGSNPIDIEGQTLEFTPNVSGGYDAVAMADQFEFSIANNLGLGDDDFATVTLPFTFNFFGTDWTEIYVNSNGAVSFGGPVNASGFYDPDEFFSTTPKLLPLYADLDPGTQGTVYGDTFADRAVITWLAVTEFGNSGATNTFQVVLFADGTYRLNISALNMLFQISGAPTYIGIHPGGVTNPTMLDWSDDLPYGGSGGEGMYESFLNLSNPAVNEVALMQRFYQSFDDVFFQTVFFTNFVQTMAGFANELNISNDVTGIGLSIFDNSVLYGSSGVLESRCNMNRMGVWPIDPTSRFFGKGNNFLTIMGQEAGHRWGAFMRFMDDQGQVSNMILGRSDAHWSYYVDVDHSSLEGGNWAVDGAQYRCPTQIDYFSAFDEYTFGLRTPEEVSPTFYVSSPSNDLPGARSVGTPLQNASAFGVPIPVTIESIIAAEGPRTPLPNVEEKDLRQGFILVLQNGTTATQQQLDQIAGFRAAWEPYFELSCSGRMTLNTRLEQSLTTGTIAGKVRDRTTGLPVEDLTITEDARGFEQYVPAGGNFYFRYQQEQPSDLFVSALVTFSAPGYYPQTWSSSAAFGFENPLNVSLDPVPTSVPVGTPLPNALYANTPNPFNPTTAIRFDLAEGGPVKLGVYDVSGRLVRELVDATLPAGRHDASWDGYDRNGVAVASGVYFYRLAAPGFQRTRKMTLIK